jgi:HD-GYP domain-containing protein (c-di-GMP phosphodiesterase class II)
VHAVTLDLATTHTPIEAFGHEFVVTMVDVAMHGSGSSALGATRDRLRDALARLRGSGPGESRRAPDRIELGLGNGRVTANGTMLLGASLQAGPLLRAARDAHVRSLEIEFDGPNAIRPDDILAWFGILGGSGLPASPQEWQNAITQAGIRGLQVVLDSGWAQDANASSMGTPKTGFTAAEALESTRALQHYQQIAEVLQQNHVAAWRGEDLDVDAAEGIVEQTLRTMQQRPSELLALAQYDDVDRFTVGHSVRVSLLAMHVAAAAGADAEGLLRVGTAALLHDVGKGRVPPEILFKPGRLDDDEWREMAKHPRLGAEILVGQRGLHPTAITASFCHHMAPDGSGYPQPLIAFRPSSVSRLVRVCDTFEALTAIRPYKPSLSPVEAYVIMHRQGMGGLDPGWLAFFVRTIGLYPLGTQVLLDDGSRGVVEADGPGADRPIVRLVAGPQGAALEPDAQTLVTVGSEHEGREVRVLHGHAAASARDEGPSDPAARARIAARHAGGACLGEHGPDVPCGDDRCGSS